MNHIKHGDKVELYHFRERCLYLLGGEWLSLLANVPYGIDSINFRKNLFQNRIKVSLDPLSQVY